jgi:hypothetical protein
MVTTESLRLDSIGIAARKGETEPQHHERGKIIEDHYSNVRKELDKEVKRNPFLSVSESVPIEECGFEKPLMPILHMHDLPFLYMVRANAYGAAMPSHVDRERNIFYSLPVIRSSVQGERLDVAKEHEELHCIRDLIEDVGVMTSKRSRKDFLLNVFYNRRKVKELPVHLYGELPSYLTSDISIKDEAKMSGKNFETNIDAMEYVLDNIYTKPIKRDAVVSIATAGAGIGTSTALQLSGASYFLAGYAVFSGIRAATKSIEYYKVKKINSEFVKTAELMEDLCRQTDYSFMPTVSRLGYREIKPSLEGIKAQGVENFFKGKISDPKEGFRWEIMYEKTLATKGMQKCEL